MDWKKKLGSRKLWLAVAGLVASIIVVFGVSDNTVAQVSAMITALGSVCAYIFGEATIDAERIKQNGDDDK